MAHTGFKAYRVKLAALGFGITWREARWCWQFVIPPERVAAKVQELRDLGLTKGPRVARGRPFYGELDPRVKRAKAPRPEPLAIREIPIGGYPGMQRDINIMRAENRGPIERQRGMLPAKVQRQVNKLDQRLSLKDWDREDD